MNGTVKANITIAGKIYPVRIKVEDEERFKNAEAFIKSRISEKYYKDGYSHIEKQDILAITLLNVTAELLEYKRLDNKLRAAIEDVNCELAIYLEQQRSLDNVE